MPDAQKKISKSSDDKNRASMLSTDSGSTKLGEIPRHKWLTPWEPPVESEDNEDSSEEENLNFPPKHRNEVGLKFWRRLRQKK